MVFGLHQIGRIYFSESTYLRDQTDQTIRDTANENEYKYRYRIICRQKYS